MAGLNVKVEDVVARERAQALRYESFQGVWPSPGVAPSLLLVREVVAVQCRLEAYNVGIPFTARFHDSERHGDIKGAIALHPQCLRRARRQGKRVLEIGPGHNQCEGFVPEAEEGIERSWHWFHQLHDVPTQRNTRPSFSSVKPSPWACTPHT